METISGIVEAVFQKTKNTRAGEKKFWYAVIDGREVSFSWTKPGYNVGDTASVDVEQKFGELQIIKPGAPASTGGGGGYKKSGGGGGYKEDPKKQQSIARQNALGHATKIVLATTDPEATADDMADEIIRIADKLVRYSLLETNVE